MARIRSIKPEFWVDEKIVDLSMPARLLFIGLWNFADDEGRMVRSPKKIKLQIFPDDQVDVAELLKEIEGKELVYVYTVDGSDYIQITNFAIHQKIDKRSASKLPSPPKPAESPRVAPKIPVGGEGKGVDVEGKGGGEVEIHRPQIEVIPVTSDLPQPGLSELEYARYFWEELGMPTSRQHLEIAGQAIKNYARAEVMPMHVVVVTLLARAQIARDSGATINRFWFEDGKHTGKGVGDGLTKTEQRITNNRKNLAAGAADYLASRGVVGHPRTDVPDGSSDTGVDPALVGKPRLLPPSGSR